MAATDPRSGSPDELKARGMNMYTVMLMLSFLFLLIGCVALGTELARYGFELRPGFKLL